MVRVSTYVVVSFSRRTYSDGDASVVINSTLLSLIGLIGIFLVLCIDINTEGNVSIE